jgi:hypothetical protein
MGNRDASTTGVLTVGANNSFTLDAGDTVQAASLRLMMDQPTVGADWIAVHPW